MFSPLSRVFQSHSPFYGDAEDLIGGNLVAFFDKPFNLVSYISFLIELIEPDQLAIVVFCRIGLLNNNAITSPRYTCSQDAVLALEKEAFYDNKLGIRAHLNSYPVNAGSCHTLQLEEVAQLPEDICRTSKATRQNNIFLENGVSIRLREYRRLGEGTYH